MRKVMCLLLIVFLASCKSKAVLVATKTPANIVKVDSTTVTSDKIILKNSSNKIDFSTVYIRASAKYRHDDDSQSVSAEIKIKKNEQILVSIRFLGITMAKALITPSKVKYYEKISGTYFEGDYASLSEWLGTDLDFYKVQNMLIGKPIDDLTKQTYTFTETDNFYKLNAVQDQTEKSFFFEAEHFLLKKQEINQPMQERSFEVNYPNFQQIATTFLPANLKIIAMQKKRSEERRVGKEC